MEQAGDALEETLQIVREAIRGGHRAELADIE
jgi:hypothetical protein